MNNLELLNIFNEAAINDKYEVIVDQLNILFDNGRYKDYLDTVFVGISITQMYGFISYLSDEEKEQFLEWDAIRSNSYSGNRMNFYNKGQLSLLMELEKHKKVFLSAPTSFGKTSLVLEFILENFHQLKNILFIVPTNSLLEELYGKLIVLNKTKNMGYNISTQPTYKKGVNNLLLVTPERFLLVSEDTEVSTFDLIIMDETYKIVDSKDEKISDFIETRALRFRKVADIIGATSKRLILLSPFTYEETESMKKYLDKYNIKRINRKFEYVKRDIIDVSSTSQFKLKINVDTQGYLKRLPIPEKVNIILSNLKNKKNIVYVSDYSSAYKIVDKLSWGRGPNVNDRYTKFLNHLVENYTVDSQIEWKLISALKKGIGIYISPLPRYIKKELIKLYEDDVIGTLIVTTAFTEGVNTNASNLIFTTLINGPTTNKLSSIDVLNVAGRAGRFAQNSIGRVYCISQDIYDKIIELQNQSLIKLENYNYYQGSNLSKIDYEIDMIDNQYLNEEEIIEKVDINKQIADLGLTSKELNISLNVSNKWKIILYNYFKGADIKHLYNVCKNVLNEEVTNRISSLEVIFKSIKDAFDETEINPFPCRPYDIKPYDSNSEFIWGRLYKVYSVGKTSEIVKRNIQFIKTKFNEVKRKYNLNYTYKKSYNIYLENENLKWILKYYNDDLTLNINAFYSETFKFVSNIIQYKIPFYLSFFVSILKLYMRKNHLVDMYDINKLDVKKITLLFEDGNITYDYTNLIDYGISNDIIMKLHENKISMEKLKNENYNKEIFDEYEMIIINEFLQIL